MGLGAVGQGLVNVKLAAATWLTVGLVVVGRLVDVTVDGGVGHPPDGRGVVLIVGLVVGREVGLEIGFLVGFW